ncbi:MAG: alkane 1-monooxygenase [Chthoniobacteraceae bacterium]
MKRAAYLLSLVPAIFAVTGNLLGAWWTLAGTAFLAALIVPDWLWKAKARWQGNEVVPDAVLVCQALLQTASVASLIIGIWNHTISGWFVVSATYSTGLAAGAGGLTTAHEMIHRRCALHRWLGIWLCLLNRYSHYYIEHLQGHHRNVGLADDPTTARLGEDFYRFYFRIIPQQFWTALQMEASRLESRGRLPYGWRNFVVASTALEWLLMASIFAGAGWIALAAFFFQGGIARFFWEAGSYVQHYGLVRQSGDSVDETHSWQCNSVVSRLMLVEIVRHSDHHSHSARHYPDLASRDYSPELPAGTFGLFAVVLLPPLWFALAHPLLRHAAELRAAFKQNFAHPASS